MKSSRLMIAVAFAMFVLLTPAFAQNGAIEATIPFDFTFGKQTLAAGYYRVTIDRYTLWVAGTQGPGLASVLISNIGGGPHEDLSPRLVFHCYGNHRFLSEVWIGEGTSYKLSATATEMEYARTTHQDRRTVLAARMNNK